MKRKWKSFLMLSSLSCTAIPTVTTIVKEELSQLNATTTTQGPNYNWVILITIIVATILFISTIVVVIILQSRKNKRYKEEIDLVYDSLARPDSFYSAKDLYKTNQQNMHRLQAPQQPALAAPQPMLSAPQHTLGHQQVKQPGAVVQQQTTVVRHQGTSNLPPPPPKVELNAPNKSFAPMKKTKK